MLLCSHGENIALNKKNSYLQLGSNALFHTRHPPARVIVHIVLVAVPSPATLGNQIRQQFRLEFSLLVAQPLLREPTLRIQRRGRPASRARDRLAVDSVGNVAASEYARDGGPRARAPRQDVT